MSGSFRIGRIAGIDINIHVSWLIILVLLTFSLASGYFPTAYPGHANVTYVILGLVSTLLLFVSVLLHELAHSFVARARGLPVHSIVLFIFGGVSNIEQEPQTAGVEFSMALVGPLTSLLIGAICYGLLLAGLITLSDVRHVPREQWAQTPVGLAMVPVERLHTVTAQQSLKEVLTLMNGRDVNQLPVVLDGKLVGVLTRDAILRSLEVRRTLGLSQKSAA